MKFQIGDRVRVVLKNVLDTSIDNKLGTIVAFKDVDVLHSPYEHYPAVLLDSYDGEIWDRGTYQFHYNIDPELLEPIDKQMLFDFMKE